MCPSTHSRGNAASHSSPYLFIGLIAVGVSLQSRSSAAQPDEWSQEEKLIANDPVAGIGFGDAVWLGPNVAYVGATANGVANVSAGAVYVLYWEEADTQWSHAQKLTADDGALDDRFGWSVAAAQAVIVGAPDDDDNGNLSGSAYVFRFDGDQLVQEQKLTADDGEASDRFGRAVATSGDVAVVGAPEAAGEGGPTGAAYVFRYDGDSWHMEQKLQVGTFSTIGELGASVAASGDRVLIGVPHAGPGAQNLGAAYVFKYDGESWQQEAVLSASVEDPQDMFGSSVALEGDVALVGVPQDEAGGAFSGAAYVFRYDGETWQEEDKLLADDAAEDDRFGTAVGLSGSVAVVGAPGANSGGAAYVFEVKFDFPNPTTWELAQKIAPEDPGIGDNFGQSVSAFTGIAVTRQRVLVGASNNDDGGESAGSAYTFNRGGTGTATEEIPSTFATSLHAYPNPFGRHTTLAYELAHPGWVRLAVYDALGRRVVQLPAQYQPAGAQKVDLNSESLGAGVYVARLESQGTTASIRIVRVE